MHRFQNCVTRIKRNSVTKSRRSKTKTVLKSVHFLENFRAIKQSSSQHTKKIFFLVHSTKMSDLRRTGPGVYFEDRP